MNIEQEIRAQIEKNKGLKLAVGEINNHLSVLEGLLRNERDDVQKQVNEAYHRGVEDGRNEAWKAARRISVFESNGGLAGKELMEIYGTVCIHKIYDNNSASEAIEKLKAYEEKHKVDDKIEVGDEVDWDGDRFIVTRVYKLFGDKKHCDGIGKNGCVYNDVLVESLVKTGRTFPLVASIVEEMTK